jgi:hypothetical protein
MNFDLSHLAPFIWVLAAILAIIVVFAILRFFWRYILKYLFHGCVVIVAIVILYALLRYLKVF